MLMKISKSFLKFGAFCKALIHAASGKQFAGVARSVVSCVCPCDLRRSAMFLHSLVFAPANAPSSVHGAQSVTRVLSTVCARAFGFFCKKIRVLTL